MKLNIFIFHLILISILSPNTYAQEIRKEDVLFISEDLTNDTSMAIRNFDKYCLNNAVNMMSSCQADESEYQKFYCSKEIFSFKLRCHKEFQSIEQYLGQHTLSKNYFNKKWATANQSEKQILGELLKNRLDSERTLAEEITASHAKIRKNEDAAKGNFIKLLEDMIQQSLETRSEKN